MVKLSDSLQFFQRTLKGAKRILIVSISQILKKELLKKLPGNCSLLHKGKPRLNKPTQI